MASRRRRQRLLQVRLKQPKQQGMCKRKLLVGRCGTVYKNAVVEISTRAHLGHVSILNSGEPATSPRPGQCVSRSSGRTAQEEGALPVCFSGEEPQEAREEEAAAASAREGGSRCCEGGRAACAVAWPQLSQLPASPGQPWPAPASPASPGGQPRPAPASLGQPASANDPAPAPHPDSDP